MFSGLFGRKPRYNNWVLLFFHTSSVILEQEEASLALALWIDSEPIRRKKFLLRGVVSHLLKSRVDFSKFTLVVRLKLIAD